MRVSGPAGSLTSGRVVTARVGKATRWWLSPSRDQQAAPAARHLALPLVPPCSRPRQPGAYTIRARTHMKPSIQGGINPSVRNYQGTDYSFFLCLLKRSSLFTALLI